MPNGYNERLCLVGVERAVNESEPQPSLDLTQVVHSCILCGALVRDTAMHDRWHGAQMLATATINEAIDRLEEGEQ